MGLISRVSSRTYSFRDKMLRLNVRNTRRIVNPVRSMFIEVDDHQPNPNALRFLPQGQKIIDAGKFIHYIPEITKVVQVENEVEKIAQDEFEKFEAKLNSYKEEEQKEEKEAAPPLEESQADDELLKMIRTKPKDGT